MNAWLTIRTFCAVLVLNVGIGLIFVRSEDMRIFVGAVLASVGITFLIRLFVELRLRH